MLKSNKIGKIQWIHLNRPKEREVKNLGEEFNIHPLIIDELLLPSDRTKVEKYDDYIFMVYHLPIYDNEHRTSRRAELDIIATHDRLITVSYEELEPLTQFEHDLKTRLEGKIRSTAEMIYYIIEEFHTCSLRQLKHVEKKVNFVGDQLFKRQDRKLLEEISYIKRDILDFAIIGAPQRTTLESLLEIGVGFWGPDFKIYFNDLLGGLSKVNYVLENLKATVEAYSETVSQIFQFKTSEIIRRFSILGFLTFPLLLYATITLQPKAEMTIIQNAQDYWLQLGTIAILVIIIAIIFRKKGWL